MSISDNTLTTNYIHCLVPMNLSTFQPIRYRRIFGHFAVWLDCPKSVLSNAHINYSSLFQLLPSQTRLAEIANSACVERSNVLAKRSLKLTQVFNLRLLATPIGQALRALALTCDDFRSLWSRSSLHASGSKFFTNAIISQLKTG